MEKTPSRILEGPVGGNRTMVEVGGIEPPSAMMLLTRLRA